MDFSPAANLKIARCIAAEELICMRESRITGVREYVPPSLLDPRALVAALNSSTAVSVPRAHGPIQGWIYYCSKEDSKKLLGSQDDTPPGRVASGPKTRVDWKWVVAREVIRRLMPDKKFPTTKEMLDYCGTNIRYVPDASDMRKLLKELKEKKD
ncbi:hypothetical protein [Bradyrhizobium huanghuaihaiense]|uniref:hypothetical protein n=1 Tax=Bradyrhizobium huanghuaihaiense TaxID=990078 RepID=UPI0011A77F25|nr:hypothetical protein [Bradyrhizobium huanghuaihaiense]